MKRAIPFTIVVGFLLCFAIAFVISRVHRRMQNQRRALNPVNLTVFTSLDPIDAHTHISQTSPAFTEMLERLHLHVLDILYVDDRDPFHTSLERQKEDARKFLASSADRAQLCTTFDPFPFRDANFSKTAVQGLNEDFEGGAIAAKVWKNVGMEIMSGKQYLMPDDPLFQPIYRDIAEQNKTLITHSAGPDIAWTSRASSIGYYAENPQWDMFTKPDAPEKKTIIQARDHLLAMNPGLRVIGAHFGSMEDHLDDLALRLDLYPNFAVDTAARVRILARQPREKARAFMIKYQDRILYGTDLHYYAGTTGTAAAQSWQAQYADEWRYFSSGDTFEYDGLKVEGLNLPLSVLHKLYHDNAVKWIPGIIKIQH